MKASKLFLCVFSFAWNFVFGQITNEIIHKNSAEPNVMDTREINSPKKSKTSNFGIESKKSLQSINASFVLNKKNASYQMHQKNPSISYQNEMNKAVDELKQNAPNSFEYHLYKYIASNHDVKLISHLHSAKRINPNNTDLQIQLASYYFIKEDKKGTIENLKYLFEKGKIDVEMINYAKDLLSSVTHNGVLLTHGFDDTFSVLYAQTIEKFRNDVELIPMEFLLSEYFIEVINKKGIQAPKNKLINGDFINNLLKNNQHRVLHLSLTIPKNYFEQSINDLEVLGLTLSKTNNLLNVSNENQRIFEEVKTRNKLTGYHSDKLKKLSSNYLPMLILLKQEFELINDLEKVKEVEVYLKTVSVQSKKENDIKSFVE